MTAEIRALPPPSGEAIALLAALSNPATERHQEALKTRDEALSKSHESYGNVVINFARILACPSLQAPFITQVEMDVLKQIDPTSFLQLEHDPTLWKQFRQMAGLLVKNSLLLKTNNANVYALTPDASSELKRIFLRCVIDPDSNVRNIVGTCIAACCSDATHLKFLDGNKSNWPELLPILASCLKGERNGAHGVNGAFNALLKLCEDVPRKLNVGDNDLISLFLQYLDAPEEKHRKMALQCLNFMIELMPPALVVNMNTYLGGLSKLATDNNASVRQQVCRAIDSLLSLRTEYIEPHFSSISEFMLTATSDSEPSVALDACEFWLTFASLDDEIYSDNMVQTVRAMIPRLVPVLLNGMVYPPDKIEELMEQNAYDENQSPDRVQDVAPVFHKNRQSRGVNDDDSDHDDGDGNDGDNEWSLRKCSAASLDVFAGMYGPSDILPPLLPSLQEGLASTNPWVREASILALGAIAEGCLVEMEVHMPQLFPFLMEQLNAELPQLRCIACWTVSRYGVWIAKQAASTENQHQQSDIGRFVCESLMRLALDRNKKVQVAACSAFGSLIEHCAELFSPLLDPIYRNLMAALGMYQAKSLMVLFDTLGVMADYLGQNIGTGDLPAIYVPPLIHMWESHKDPLSRQLLPLVESIASIVATIGPQFQPWALQVFDKCVSTIENCTLVLATAVGAYDELRAEDYDSIVCCADVLDGLVEGLGESFAALLDSSKYGPHFLSLLHTLCSHDVPGVRMSAFAMLGDLARKCPSVIEPGISELLKQAIMCIDPLHPNVCNNSIWAIGEVCVRCGKNSTALSPYARDILDNLIPIIMGNSINGKNGIPGLTENAAATIGRLARVDSNFVKDDLPRFLNGWCEGLANIADADERRDAFEGLLLAIQSNPQAIMTTGDRSRMVSSLILAIVSWHLPRDDESGLSALSSDALFGPYNFVPFPNDAAELGQAFQQLLREIKSALGPEWDASLKMPGNVKRLLAESYQIS